VGDRGLLTMDHL